MSVVLPIEEDPRFRIYTASEGQAQFAVQFPFQQNEDVILALQIDPGTWQTLSPTLYTLSGAGDPAGGMATFHSGRTAGDVLLVLGSAILDRLGSIVRDGRFNSRLTDDEFDRSRIIQQEHARDIRRAVKVQFGQPEQGLPVSDGVSLLGWSPEGKLVNRQGEAESAAEAQAAAEIAVGAANGKFEFDTRADAIAANIPAPVRGVSLRSRLVLGDGRGGLYIDMPNGSTDTFVSADGRTWYSAVPQAMRRFADAAALALATVTSAAIMVGGVIMQPDVNGPFPDALGNKYAPATYVTPRMFAAKGDGAADDRAPVQASWIYAARAKIPCLMEGLEYNCSEAVNWDSNLAVHGQGAVMYITAWPASGGFVNNVWMPPEPESRRLVSNIYFSDLILDGSKLPPPLAGQNTNLWGGARGLSDARFVRCVGRKMREGSGGGTGGGAFGIELGATNVLYEDCVAEDAFRGLRVGGQSDTWGAPTNASKRAIGIVARNFTARRCGTALFAHAVGSPTGDRNVSDLGVFDFVWDGGYAEDCGHAAWRDFDFVANPTILPQKAGVFTFAHGRNITIRDVRVKINTDLTTRADWLGRVGYPAAGTSYIGAGLSGNVGALVWGHGRNILMSKITLDGSVDTIYQCARAITFGDHATVPPTNGSGSVEQVLFDQFRHVRGTHDYIFDGQAGLDDTKMSVQFTRLLRIAAPQIGVVGPNGTAGLTNVRIQDVRAGGIKAEFTVAEILANGNAIPGTGVGDDVSFGSKAFGGGYHATGGRYGTSYDPVTNVWRFSSPSTTSQARLAFYTPGGLVGSISTTNAGTAYNVTSDETRKDFIGELSGATAIDIIKADPVREFTWKESGNYAVGWGAQTSYQVSHDLATPGGWMDPLSGEAVAEDHVRWISPLTGEPVAEDWTGIDDRHYYDLLEELDAAENDYYGEPDEQDALVAGIRAQIAEIEATAPRIFAQKVVPVYVPWGVDQAKRTPYLWAATAHLVGLVEQLRAELDGLKGQLETLMSS